jgi:hypothetical protein
MFWATFYFYLPYLLNTAKKNKAAQATVMIPNSKIINGKGK